MSTRGRPALKQGVPFYLWVMVELMRDREGRPPLSVRGGAAVLAKRIPRDIVSDRVWNAETIRRHHKAFETLMRRSNSGDERRLAERLLTIGRARRQGLGRQTNIWLLVAEPSPAEIELADKLAAIGRGAVHSDPN